MEIIGQTTIEAGGGLDNSGLVSVDAPVQFQGGEINNAGTLQLIDGTSLLGAGSLINNGVIEKTGGGTSKIEPTFTSSGTIDTGAGSVELAGPVAMNGLTKFGSGKLTISGAITPTEGAGMDIYDGTLDLKTEAGGLNLTAVGSNTQVHLNGDQHLGILGVNDYAVVNMESGGSLLEIQGINLKYWNESEWEAKGKLDINDGTLISYDLGAIDYLLATPSNLYGGGIVSGEAQSQGMVLGYKVVEYAPEEVYALITTTTPGDTDMDGTVSAADAQAVQDAINGTPTGNGDANYDGVVNAADLDTVNQHMDSTAHDMHLHWGELAAKVASGNMLSLVDTGGKSVSAHALDNYGTIALSGAGDVTLSGGGSINNTGTFDVQRDGNVVVTGTGGGSLINSGTLRKSAGTGVSLIPSGIAFSNPGGTIDVQTGTIRLDNSLSVDAGSSLTKTGDGTFDVTGGLVVNGSVTHSAGTLSNAYAYVFGNYNQSGGVHQAGSNYMLLGNTLPAQAVYTLSGGELHAPILSLGFGGGAGQIVQTGGVVSLLNLSVAGGEWGGTGGTGDYQMQGGQLSGSGQMVMGSLGTATFNQTGGDVAFAGPVIIGQGAGTGQYTISAGTLSASYLQVGDTGATGGFTQSGGTTTVGELYVSTTGGTGTVNVNGGNLTVGAGGLGPVTNHGTINQTAGTATFGDFSGSGAVTVSGTGSLTANHVRQDSLTVNGTGLVTIRPTGCGDGPGQPGGTSVVKNLTMGRDANGAPTAKIDLANNHLVVDWSAPGRSNPVEDVNSMLRAAYNTGNWDGNGLTSSRLSGHWSSQSIGIMDNSVVSTPYTTFGGQSVPLSATLVRYTLAGDATLDGTVDFDDLVKVDQNYNLPGTYHWWEGDFTYDGVVDFNDMVKLDQNYNTTLTCPEGGANMTASDGLGTDSAMTITGVDSDQFAAEMSVLDDLREKIAASDPDHLPDFDAFVAQWWSGDTLAPVASAAAEQGTAFSAAVPEPSGAMICLLTFAGAISGRRRRRKQ